MLVAIDEDRRAFALAESAALFWSAMFMFYLSAGIAWRILEELLVLHGEPYDASMFTEKVSRLEYLILNASYRKEAVAWNGPPGHKAYEAACCTCVLALAETGTTR